MQNLDQKKMSIFIAAAVGVLLIIVTATLMLSSRSKTAITQTPSTSPTPYARPTLPDYSKLTQEQTLQSYHDRETAANAQDAQIQKTFPWLNELPLQTEDFFLYFNVRSAKFTALIYAQPSRLEEVKATIKQQMQSKNIPTGTYEILYVQK
jgi:hypothetical protein